MSDVVSLRVLNTAWTAGPEWVLLRGGGHRRVRLPVLVALFRHPRHGWGLFDAGWSMRVRRATRRWPFLIYATLVGTRLPDEGELVAQLDALGVRPTDIRWILLSHFHADHMGSLADFPAATIHASRSGFEDVRARSGWSAMRRAFVPGLLPPDVAQRLSFIEGVGPGVAPMSVAHDLFGDGTIQLLNLPGHARGQFGALVRTATGPVLLAADGCWLTRSFRENRPPHRITRVFADDVDAAEQTVAALGQYARLHPDVDIIPAHCPDAWARHASGAGS